MSKLATWLGERRLQSLFVGGLVVLGALAGWYATVSWDNYNSATQSYVDSVGKFSALGKKIPPPTPLTLQQITQAVASEQSGLDELLQALQKCSIPAFGDLEKAKPQNAPQLFQDALREQVSSLKSEAAAKGSTLPPLFYLGLEEYDSKLPAAGDVYQLSRQLTVFTWIANRLVSQSGLILTEFSRILPPSSAQKNNRPGAATNGMTPPQPYEIVSSLRLSFRCDQACLRSLLNAFAQSPYFLVIDSLELRNTVTEPPRRLPSNPAAQPTTTGQHLPVIVGREQLTALIRVRILEFPSRITATQGATK